MMGFKYYLIGFSLCASGLAACSGDLSPGTSTLGDTESGTNVTEDTNSHSATDVDCDTDCQGVCVGGQCCDFDRACGTACCSQAEVCFANACVTPGGLCHSAADCQDGEYCEPALGDEDEPDDSDTGEEGQVCLADAPSAGRCLELPKTCEPDDTDGDCLHECEYHPPTGPLDAVVKWYWGTNAQEFPAAIDIWATPAVGRAYDTNCDGVIDDLDPPVIFFIAGDAKGTWCGKDSNVCGDETLRAVDGASGKELWTLEKASPDSKGFASMSVALADIDHDAVLDIITATGEGYIVMVDAKGHVKRTSDKIIEGSNANQFGWGGGFAIADMNGDSFPEIAFGNQLFTTENNAITRQFVGTGRTGGGMPNMPLSTFVDLDGAPDGYLELLAGPTAYKFDGSILWDNTDVPEGFPGVGDFDNNGTPEVVVVSKGQVYVLKAADGKIVMGPLPLGGDGDGGPPTVADFDGDGYVEIGVAQKNYYYVVKPHLESKTLAILWKTANHDFSSSVTGSTVFDFEGDGAAEVIYKDECFLWVFDGKTGRVRFATPTTSFTGTEAAMVADVDGDGRAELLMIANGADPSSSGWKCDVSPWNTLVESSDNWDPDNPPHPAWEPPQGQVAFRGLWAFGSKSNSWVGTRTLWNQHTYHVTNICDHRDNACDPPNIYGSVPAHEKNNWDVPWLNNFRQNVQDTGMFNAPDATLTLRVECWPDVVLIATLQNKGTAILPAGVEVGFYVSHAPEELLGTLTTVSQIFPGQGIELEYPVDTSSGVKASDFFQAKILIDPANILFHECLDDNNQSELATCPGSGVF